MISRRKSGHFVPTILAAAFFAAACAHTDLAPPAGGMGTLAATHQPAQEAQARIVIPEDWKATDPFSKRFPTLQTSSEPGTHIIDLAAIRFETDSLVSVSPGGQRTFAPPDLSSFPPQLNGGAFRMGEEDYFIVQANDPKGQTALRQWLEQSGIAVLDYIPQYAYLVRVSEKQLAVLQQRPEVFWMGHFAPAYRIDPIVDFIIQMNASQQIQMRMLFDSKDYADVQSLIEQLRGLGLTGGKHALRAHDWTIHVSGSAIRARDAALLRGCLWVERYVAPELDNSVARTSQNVLTGRGASSGPIMDVEDVWARGIRGEGQIASAADTGLSTGNLATLHQDFGQQGSGTNPMRVTAGYGLGRVGNWNDDQTTGGGHGTHTSGSIVGNGFRSGSTPSTNTFPTTSYAGTAPKAQFVFQSIMDSGGALGGLPGDLNTLFQQTYNDGARVHSNSWGASVAGAYTTDSQEVDQFAWRNKDMVITFSAGNSGTDGSSPVDGIINRDSIGSPGTAKNCITVGASENYLPGFIYEYPAGDCTSSDGIEQKTWGWFSGNYATNPIFSDLMADNANGVVAFSSRGPTDDGRFKPDVVAPGTAIISARTDVNQAADQWGICSIPAGVRPYYMTMGGTSMSNPLTAGVATLVRQYYVDGWHPNNSAVTNLSAVGGDGFNPSSALVKATLINGAWDMNPGQYGTGSTREIVPGWDTGATLPNNAEGFGRVDAEKSLFPGSGYGDVANRKLQVHDVTPGLTTGTFTDYTFTVGGTGNPLIVTLVWTDPQGASGAGVKLVNNLDLIAIAPGGATTYFPNGVDKTSGADSLNNVEQVKVTSPASGVWTLRVTGTSVPGNAESGSTTQPYALVISGVGCSNAPSIPAGVTATPGVNKVTVNWSASTGSPVSYKVYRSGPGGSCPAAGYSLIATVTAPTVTYDDLTTSGGSLYSYKVASAGASCESNLSSCASATSNGGCTLAPTFAGLTSVTASAGPGCSLNLAWAAGTANCTGSATYNIYRSASSGFTPGPTNKIAMGVSGLTYSDVNVAGGSTYYYVVRAAQNGIEETNSVERSGAALIQTTLYTENFDALAPGNLAGFTLSGVGTADWRGVMACSPNQSAANVFRFGGNGCTTNYLDNSSGALATLNGASGLVIPGGATNLRLSFWHRWEFESFYDGGQIRIRRSTDGSYTTVPASAILTNPYNGTATGSAPVWTGSANTSMTNSVVNLDAACNAIAGNTGGCAGKTIFIAFTAITDSSITYDGWFIDNVQVTYEGACTACTPPGAPTGLTLTTPVANVIHLSWVSGAPAGVSYNVYREAGTCPMSTPRLIASGITATTYDDPGRAGGTTHRYIVRAVSAGGCESGSSNCQSAAATGGTLPAPPNFAAAGASTSTAFVSWQQVAGAAYYVIERSASLASFTQIAVTPGLSLTDTGLAASTSYLYRVFARDSGGTLSAESTRDLATTVVFVNQPLTAGTVIQAAHITQLRTAVNAVRTLAGIGPGSYPTDPTITPGSTFVRLQHISELRLNLDAARGVPVLLLPALSYTDPSLTTSTLVKAVHVQELRNGAN